MRTTNVVFAAMALGLIAASSAVACSGTPDVPGAPDIDTGSEVSGPQVREDVVLGWTLDVTRLSSSPRLSEPSGRLAAEAFDAGHASASLVDDDAPLSLVRQVRSRARYESATFSFELDPDKGALLALRRDPAQGAGDVSEQDIQNDARARLRAWGIPDDEVASVATRKLLAQDDARGDKPSAPRLVAYKTFVTRGIGGVPVAGHRAVVTHDLDGRVRKVLAQWPVLAPSGHALRTPLSLGEIEHRVAARLTELGKTRSHARLAWTLEPSAGASGSTRLTLKVAAALAGIDHGDIVDEPEVELVDVESVP